MSEFSLSDLGNAPKIIDPDVDTQFVRDPTGSVRLVDYDYDEAQKFLGPIARYGDPTARFILDSLDIQRFGDIVQPDYRGYEEPYQSPCNAFGLPDSQATTRRTLQDTTRRLNKEDARNRTIDYPRSVEILDGSIFKIDRLLREYGIAHQDFTAESSIVGLAAKKQAKVTSN